MWLTNSDSVDEGLFYVMLMEESDHGVYFYKTYTGIGEIFPLYIVNQKLTML